MVRTERERVDGGLRAPSWRVRRIKSDFYSRGRWCQVDWHHRRDRNAIEQALRSLSPIRR